MNKWIVIYDRFNYNFISNFVNEYGTNRNIIVEFLPDIQEKVRSIKNGYNIFIAIFDTNKIIECVSNISYEIKFLTRIFSVSTADLLHFSIRAISIKINNNYFDITNECLFGRVKELALPIENISTYDFDNKTTSCLNNDTKISNLVDAGPGAYLAGYGIEKKSQWRTDPENSLEFSNLALAEAVQNKNIFMNKNLKFFFIENNIKYYGSYNAYKIDIPLEISLAFAGLIISDKFDENTFKLESNPGIASGKLFKLLF